MDFTKFDSRAAASKPQSLHLSHPVTGDLLYDDNDTAKPCTVLVLGTESPAAQKAMSDVARAKLKFERASDKLAEKTLEEIHKALADSARTLIVGFENVMRGDKPATVADADWFLNLQLINGQPGEKSFVEQVTDFATKRANFLGNA